jgi:hypothetical protein
MSETITITKANLFELTPKSKYLLILPRIDNPVELSEALQKFFPEVKIMAIAVKDVSQVKIAELFGEEK